MYLGVAELIVLALALVPLLLALVGAWSMFGKAGYPGALAFLVLLPVVGWILLFWFGNADWPLLQRLRKLEQGRLPPPPPSGGGWAAGPG
jgi:hypothetical protein